MLEFQGETRNLLRADSNIGSPFPRKQGNLPSSRLEEGENGALLELWRETRCSSRVGTGISGTFLSCIKGVKYSFAFQEQCLETLLWKRASSRIEGRILWLFTGCGGKQPRKFKPRRSKPRIFSPFCSFCGFFSWTFFWPPSTHLCTHAHAHMRARARVPPHTHRLCSFSEPRKLSLQVNM